MGLHFHGGIGVISAPICSILLRSLSIAVVGLVGLEVEVEGVWVVGWRVGPTVEVEVKPTDGWMGFRYGLGSF